MTVYRYLAIKPSFVWLLRFVWLLLFSIVLPYINIVVMFIFYFKYIGYYLLPVYK